MGTPANDSHPRPGPATAEGGRARPEAGAGAWAWAGVLLVATLAGNLYYARRCGDGLSPYADSYSEANALRAGERFARDGFTVNCGLPDVTFGGRYPGVGIVGASGRESTDPVYHGYPPGSDWLAGLYIRAFGVGRLGRFRAVPVAAGVAASAVFLAALVRSLGAGRGLAVYTGCAVAPMFMNMTHGLYYHGYALSLLLLELAVLLAALGRAGRVGPGAAGAVFLLGFLQGWLSFDYCFVVTFAAAPVALLAAPAGAPIGWRKVFVLVLASGLGFTAAHALHFLQSAAYLGGVREAAREYAYRSGKTYALGQSEFITMSRPELILNGLYYYGLAYLRWTRLFSPAGPAVLALTGLVFVVRRLSFTVGERLRFDLDMAPRARDLGALAASMAVGLAWLFAKPYHAMNHIVYSERHLFLFYLACWFVVARATSSAVTREPADPARVREALTVG